MFFLPLENYPFFSWNGLQCCLGEKSEQTNLNYPTYFVILKLSD